MSQKPPYQLCKLYTFNDDTSKTWTLVFYQVNAITGKLQRRFFAGFNKSKDVRKRKREALIWKGFIDAELQKGSLYLPKSMNKSIVESIIEPIVFLDDLNSYLKYQKSYLTENSYKTYRAFVDKWRTFSKFNNLDKMLTKDLSAAICNRFVDYLLTLQISNTTRNNAIRHLKTACNYFTDAGRERWLVSPARHIRDFPASTESHESFTDQQAESVLAAISERQEWDMLLFVYFIFYTFARPGKEVRMLKVKDLRERSVVFRAKYSKTNLTKTPTMSKPLEQLIERLGIRECNPEFYVFGQGGKPGPIPVGVNYYYNRHRDLLKQLGIDGKQTLYSWKHTGNIRLFRADVDLKSIQQQNGHTSLRTTEIYLRDLGTFVNNNIYERFQ